MIWFVFGSNESGYHGAGAAHFAKLHHSAQMGAGFGPTGNAWAIPTKDWRISPLDLDEIRFYVSRFIVFALSHPNDTFHITQIGCGLAGFTSAEIAPMFAGAPKNCEFSSAWEEWIPGRTYWTDK